jgi:lysophospholipase L1-like esterase
VVVIEAGGNGIPTVEQIRAADQKLRATGARRVAWVTFADWPPSDVAENRRLTRDRIHVSAADVLTLPKPPVAKLTSDEVHFTTDGYRDLGTLIVQALRRAPASPVVVLLGGSALLAGLGYALYRLAR